MLGTGGVKDSYIGIGLKSWRQPRYAAKGLRKPRLRPVITQRCKMQPENRQTSHYQSVISAKLIRKRNWYFPRGKAYGHIVQGSRI